MLVGKAVEQLKCTSLGQAPGLSYKHWTRLGRDKHSSLLRKFINYGRKMFYKIGPWYNITSAQCYKTFLSVIYEISE
jgi:hypothetical protein